MRLTWARCMSLRQGPPVPLRGWEAVLELELVLEQELVLELVQVVVLVVVVLLEVSVMLVVLETRVRSHVRLEPPVVAGKEAVQMRKVCVCCCRHHKKHPRWPSTTLLLALLLPTHPTSP